MKQSSIILKGALILTAAGLISRVLGFFYKIFLAQALGAEGMGIYQLIFPVFSVGHALTTSGMETAIARYTASHKEKKNMYLIAGLLFSVSASCLVGLILWSRSDFIAASLLKEPRCGSLLRILALALPLSAIHSCFAGSYLGQKKAGVPAAAQLLEQSIRIGFIWLLCSITLRQGGEITPALAVFGLLAGEAASSLFMLTVSDQLYFDFFHPGKYLACCRSLLTMALPLTGTRLSLTLLQSAEAVLVPFCLQKSGLTTAQALSMYGILTGMSMSFLMFPNAVTSSISSMLLPVVSEEQAKGNREHISTAVRYTISFGLTIGILCMGIFLVYGEKLGTLVFHELLAGRFLMTLAWICPILYLTGNLSSILHGLGRTSTTFVNQLCAIGTRILFLLLLVPHYGISAVLWGILASQFVLCALGLFAIRDYFRIHSGLDQLILKPAAAMLLSLGGVELLRHLFPFLHGSLEILELFVSICLVAGGYFLLLLLFGVWKLGQLLPGKH